MPRTRTGAAIVATLGLQKSVKPGSNPASSFHGTRFDARFGGSRCQTRPGFDLATGWGSPAADVVASSLPPR
jgi:hypothetical protein